MILPSGAKSNLGCLVFLVDLFAQAISYWSKLEYSFSNSFVLLIKSSRIYCTN